jgi:predicted dehydrogenase
MSLSRRDFLRDSTLFAAAAAALTPQALTAQEEKPAKKVGPNDRIRIAVIGIHGRGKDHIKAFAKLPDSHITVLCDCDSKLADKGIKQVEDLQGSRPMFVQDLRKVMEDKEIDAVSIATPNHWHVLAALWAVQAGKDVYVEKPLSHNVWEGRRLIDAARKRERMVQCGTQSRSSTGMREAMDYIHSGKLGQVKVARGLCYKSRPSIGEKRNGSVPEGVDYDLWCGPAPLAPVTRKQFHYDWHWFWDFGNGDLGNQGVHEMDKARWGLNKKTLPNTVFSYGGRLGYEDAGETANTQVCHLGFGDSQIIFEVRGHKTEGVKGVKIGNIFYGSDGVLVSSSYTSAVVFSPDGEKLKEFKGAETHYANFLNACRTRKHTDLHCDVEEGHFSAALCHLANISLRLGHGAKSEEIEALFGASTNPLGFDEPQQATLIWLKKHFQDLGVKLGDNFRIGEKLALDPSTEQFVASGDSGLNPDANRMLTREYRTGFEVK